MKIWILKKIALFLIKPRFNPESNLAKALGIKNISVFDGLLMIAHKKPYYHLTGYMLRWWLLRHPQRPGDMYYKSGLVHVVRNSIRYLYPFYARFHLIWRKDNGDPLHNHPFGFVSLILKGWYEEEVLQEDGSVIKFRYEAGDVNIKNANSYHRITDVSDGGVTTLVIMGRRTGNSWGFMVDGKHVPYQQHLNIE